MTFFKIETALKHSNTQTLNARCKERRFIFESWNIVILVWLHYSLFVHRYNFDHRCASIKFYEKIKSASCASWFGFECGGVYIYVCLFCTMFGLFFSFSAFVSYSLSQLDTEKCFFYIKYTYLQSNILCIEKWWACVYRFQLESLVRLNFI